MFRIKSLQMVLGLMVVCLWWMSASPGLAAPAKDPNCSCSKHWIQTFRGNQHRRFYGSGYIPSRLKVRWRFKTSGFRDRRWIGSDGKKLIWRGTGWSGQAAVVGDKVWVSSVGGSLHCLNRHTGRQYWKFWAGGSIKSSVAYWNGRIYFGARSDHLFCLNAKTGKLLWKFRTPRKDVDSTPIIWKGKMYWGGEDGYLYAMNPITGKVIWKYRTMGSIESSPTIVGQQIFINSYDGHLHSLDLATGKLRWRVHTGDDTDTTPTYYKGALYFGSENGWLYAVDVNTGEKLWKRVTDGGIWSSSAVANNRVYVGSNDRRFYSIDTQTGRLVWKRIVQEGVWASPVYVNGRILFGDWAGYLYVLRASDGFRLHSYKTGAYIVSTAAVVDGNVYIGSRDGYFYAFKGPKQYTPPRRRRRRRRNWNWAVHQPKNKWTKKAKRKLAYKPASSQKLAWQRIKYALYSNKIYDRLLVARLLSRTKSPKRSHHALLQYVAQDSAGNVRLLAVQAAKNYGATGASLAMQALHDPEFRVRAAACDTLASLRWNKAVKAITQQLWVRSPDTQYRCAKALYSLGRSTLARATLRRFVWGGAYRRTRYRPVRGCPAKIAKRYFYREQGKKRLRTDPRSKRPLIHALVALANHGDRCARRALLSRWFGCRNKLGKMKNGYCSIFRDWQGWVKRMAPTLRLRFLSKRRQMSLLRIHGLPRRYDKNLRVLGILSLAHRDVPQRLRLLQRYAQRARYPVARITALRQLKRLRHLPKFSNVQVGRLAARLLRNDRNVNVRVAAAQTLASVLYKPRHKALLRAMKTRSDRVKAAAAVGLSASHQTQSLPVLKKLMHSPVVAARCTALQGLARNPKGLPVIRQTMASSDPYLRLCAIRALLQNPQTTKAWTKLLRYASQHNDPKISIRAAYTQLSK